MAPIVSQCLDEHLRSCDPFNSLPAFYLLDSISKNIGPPYITLFCRFIERAFIAAYHAVDPPTKIKLEELLGTWKTGASDGGELFRTVDEGRHGRVQHGIESVLFGGRGNDPSGAQPARSMTDAATPGERSGVLFDVRRLLQLRRDQATVNPSDPNNNHQIIALQQLEELVLDTQLTADQVFQIRGQLAQLAPALPPPPPIEQDIKPARATSANLMELAALLQPITSSLPASLPLSVPQPISMPSHPPLDVKPSPTLTLTGIDPSLLAQLQGLAGSIPGLADLFAPSVLNPKTEVQGGEGNGSEQVDRMVQAYDQALLALGIQLDNADILKARPQVVAFLYSKLGLQCKQCGLRFFDSKVGQGNMDVHLDWHFNHKRKIREGAARSQGRSWFALEADWIKADDIDSLPLTASLGGVSATASTSKLDATLPNRAELEKSFIPAPTEEPERIRCPICKEGFKSEWNEGDEDWVFYNAVSEEDIIYHATCRAEAAASKLANRQRLGDSLRPSRESTPTNSSSTSKGKGREENGTTEEGSAKKRKILELIGSDGGGSLEVGTAHDDVEEDARLKRVKLELSQ